MASSPPTTALSIAILAWNEEEAIGTALRELFRQSVFEKLAARGQRCEVVVVTNGCTDRTVEVAESTCAEIAASHPASLAFTARVVDVTEPGKTNAWNRFVHEFSARDANVLCFMDADIVFRHADTVFLLLTALEHDAHARAASGRQCKDIALKARKSWRDRISLATSTMSATGAGLICGQLYCLRADVARKIYLPRDLQMEDGFIKGWVCTDGFMHPSEPLRVAFAPHAEHIFEAYLSPRQILNNQKRQMLGQTIVHVLTEFAKSLPEEERRELGARFRQLDEEAPNWLKRKIAAHIRRQKYFWRLFPGILTFRFHRLMQLRGWKRVTHFPAACVGLAVTLIACARAHRTLRSGVVQYWPKAVRSGSVPSATAREVQQQPAEPALL